jgi:inward rectifier potassium channel
MTPADLDAVDGALTVSVSGIDDSSAQHLHARRLYSGADIRWNYRYRDITTTSKEGRLVIDYKMFDEVVPE